MHIALLLVLGGVLLVAALAALAALRNRSLPTASPIVDRLTDEDKARIAEIGHLRTSVGDEVWPGLAQADIPIILYNESYAFLAGYLDPPTGWSKMPANEQRGGPWEPVPDDSFEGAVYYRQLLPAPDITPEAFTVLVGDRWVASLATKTWMEIQLAGQFSNDLPPVLRPVFPYRLAASLLLRGTDGYLCGVLHEALHAYQGLSAPQRLEAAESATTLAESYPWDDAAVRSAWATELDLLAQALRAGTDDEAADLARRFIQQRSERRADIGPDYADYERQREWLEGLARYAELAFWYQGHTAPGYRPLSALSVDRDFKGYANYDRRWDQEVDQMKRMVSSRGDGRFYYTGMAQAMLLDRLQPGWKVHAFDDGVFLDDLLSSALNDHEPEEVRPARPDSLDAELPR